MLLSNSSFSTTLDFGSQVHPTLKKINSFGDLQAGWHFGEGELFSSEVLNAAINFHQQLIEFLFVETDAFPGFKGEVRITAYQNDFYLEFTFESKDEITVVLEEPNGTRTREKKLNLKDAIQKIASARERICNSFAPSKHISTIRKDTDSTAWLSVTLGRVLVAGSLLSTSTVPNLFHNVPAHTLQLNTQSIQTP
jgi:hypothetical protein